MFPMVLNMVDYEILDFRSLMKNRILVCFGLFHGFIGFRVWGIQWQGLFLCNFKFSRRDPYMLQYDMYVVENNGSLILFLALPSSE